MLEEACKAHAIVGQMWFFANDHDIVFSPLDVQLEDFLSVNLSVYPQRDCLVDPHESYADHAQPYDDQTFPSSTLGQLTIDFQLLDCLW